MRPAGSAYTRLGAGSNFTLAFEQHAAYLAQQCARTTVTTIMRVAWRTVGTIIRRVVQRHEEVTGDRLDGIRFIGVDELSYRRHHKYVTVVVDHERGEIVWASEGKSAATLKRFFEDLGPLPHQLCNFSRCMDDIENHSRNIDPQKAGPGMGG